MICLRSSLQQQLAHLRLPCPHSELFVLLHSWFFEADPLVQQNVSRCKNAHDDPRSDLRPALTGTCTWVFSRGSISRKSLLRHSSVTLPAGVHQRGHSRPIQQLDRNPLHLQEILQPLHIAIVHALEDRMVMMHNFGWLWRTAGLRDLDHLYIWIWKVFVVRRKCGERLAVRWDDGRIFSNDSSVTQLSKIHTDHTIRAALIQKFWDYLRIFPKCRTPLW